MPDIPTPIPESWASSTKRWFRQSVPLMVWRLLLLLGLVVLFVAASTNGSVLIATMLGIAVSYIFADDIRKTWADLWNLNFWVWRT